MRRIMDFAYGAQWAQGAPAPMRRMAQGGYRGGVCAHCTSTPPPRKSLRGRRRGPCAQEHFRACKIELAEIDRCPDRRKLLAA